MYRITLKRQFKKDFDLMKRQGRPLGELRRVIDVLATGAKLEAKYKDHPLRGEYVNCRECHVEPDWLLIYKINGNVLELILVRTGSHSELFGR